MPANERIGFTTLRSVRQAMTRDKTTKVIRVALFGRRGFTCRSMYNASCFLKNRFSAASCVCDRQPEETSRSRSPARQRAVRNDDLAMVAQWYAIHHIDNHTVDLAGWTICGARCNRVGLSTAGLVSIQKVITRGLSRGAR